MEPDSGSAGAHLAAETIFPIAENQPRALLTIKATSKVPVETTTSMRVIRRSRARQLCSTDLTASKVMLMSVTWLTPRDFVDSRADCPQFQGRTIEAGSFLSSGGR